MEATDMDIQAVKLNEAVLCINCEMITNAKNGHCPMCQSHAVMQLAQWVWPVERDNIFAWMDKESL